VKADEVKEARDAQSSLMLEVLDTATLWVHLPIPMDANKS